MSLFTYLANVERIVDGDTVDLDIDLGLRVYTRARVRLAGINAPEMRTADSAPGIAARDALVKLLPLGTRVMVKTHKDSTEKYGRWLAELWLMPADGESVNQLMVQLGHAVAYTGGKR